MVIDSEVWHPSEWIGLYDGGLNCFFCFFFFLFYINPLNLWAKDEGDTLMWVSHLDRDIKEEGPPSIDWDLLEFHGNHLESMETISDFREELRKRRRREDSYSIVSNKTTRV